MRILDGERRVVRRSLEQQSREAAAAVGQPLPFLAEADARINGYLDQVQAELRKPAWERRFPQVENDGSAAAVLSSSLMPTVIQTTESCTRQETMVRLLGCHALIRRYRWEHEELPDSLAALNAPALVVDPFTGQPFQYHVTGSRYRLTSAGPAAAPGDARAVDGRVPVSVAPD